MGCESSKQSGDKENAGTNNNGDEFTENQIDTLRSTWPLLSRDSRTNGVSIFRLIFLTEPAVKRVFRDFSHMPDEEILSDPKFLGHVDRYMHAINDMVERLDSNKDAIEETLLLLGAKHGMLEHFKVEYFNVFSASMLSVLETVIAEEFITEVKDSWEILLAFVTRYMGEGLTMYLQEQNGGLGVGGAAGDGCGAVGDAIGVSCAGSDGGVGGSAVADGYPRDKTTS